MLAEAQLRSKNAKGVVDFTMKWCERNNVTLDQIWNSANPEIIQLRTRLIIALAAHYDLWTISSVTKQDREYCRQIIKIWRSDNQRIRTTNWEKFA